MKNSRSKPRTVSESAKRDAVERVVDERLVKELKWERKDVVAKK